MKVKKLLAIVMAGVLMVGSAISVTAADTYCCTVIKNRSAYCPGGFPPGQYADYRGIQKSKSYFILIPNKK